MKIWYNLTFPAAIEETFHRSIAALETKTTLMPSRDMGPPGQVTAPTRPDPLLAEADIAFGLPFPSQLLELAQDKTAPLFWLHVATAGYTPYDREDIKTACRSKGLALTKSSLVYDEPCAQHVLAQMLSSARQLPSAIKEQQSEHDWPTQKMRRASYLLGNQNVVIMGYGSIARCLLRLLAPFSMNTVAVRRRVSGKEEVKTLSISDETKEVMAALAKADHIINLMPGTPATNNYYDEKIFSTLKKGARFYNIGRGTSVDQDALKKALCNGTLAEAYIDVTDPEPLPKNSPLWALPNLHITPHTAGGHENESQRQLDHFLKNLKNYQEKQPLKDPIPLP